MKKNILIILFFLMQIISLFSQTNIVVTYQTQFIGKVFNNENSQEKVNKVLTSATEGTEDEIRTLEFKLITNGSKSLFKAVQTMAVDNQTLAEKMGRIVAGYDNIYYRDDSLKITISDQIIGSTRYKINEFHNSNS